MAGSIIFSIGRRPMFAALLVSPVLCRVSDGGRLKVSPIEIADAIDTGLPDVPRGTEHP